MCDSDQQACIIAWCAVCNNIGYPINNLCNIYYLLFVFYTVLYNKYTRSQAINLTLDEVITLINYLVHTKVYNCHSESLNFIYIHMHIYNDPFHNIQIS